MDKKSDYCVKYVSDVRCVGVFPSTKASLKSVWARRIKAGLLFVMWRIRIKVQAFVLRIPLYSPLQMCPFPILWSVKQALREVRKEWEDRFCVFMERFRRRERCWVFSVQMVVLVTCRNTVILPQVMVCTGGRTNNLLQEVQRPVIHYLPGLSSLMVERVKAWRAPGSCCSFTSWKVEWEPTAALHSPPVYHSISRNMRQTSCLTGILNSEAPVSLRTCTPLCKLGVSWLPAALCACLFVSSPKHFCIHFLHWPTAEPRKPPIT